MKLRLWKSTLIGILILFLITVYAFTIGFSAQQEGKFFNKNHNAVWLEHKWVGEKQSKQDIYALIDNFKKYQIDTVFVHTGPLEETGLVDPKVYEYAVYFLDTAKKYDPDIEYQAWLGQIRGKIALVDPEVRHNTAQLAMTLTQMVGFDGIHYDIEPVWDEDIDFIKLLKETKEILPEDKKISVAMAEFIPKWFVWGFSKFDKLENYNSEVNYRNVAEYADQIVVMAYDTGISHGWFYRWAVGEQVIWLTSLLEGEEVFVGIPAYEEPKEGFDPKVENIGNGLKGVIKGLNNFRSNEENFAGVAIYAYWEMSEDEWGAYGELWGK